MKKKSLTFSIYFISRNTHTRIETLRINKNEFLIKKKFIIIKCSKTSPNQKLRFCLKLKTKSSTYIHFKYLVIRVRSSIKKLI